MHLGDPDLISIATTVGYFLAACLCLWRAMVVRRTGSDRRQWLFWLCVAGLYLMLGINKQADLQIQLTDSLRSLARQEGWYQRRREYQLLAASAIVGMLAIAMVASLWLIRRWSWSCYVAWLASCLQLSYVGMRMISFHHVDQWLGFRLGSLPLWQMIELCGTLLCILAAASASSKSAVNQSALESPTSEQDM